MYRGAWAPQTYLNDSLSLFHSETPSLSNSTKLLGQSVLASSLDQRLLFEVITLLLSQDRRGGRARLLNLLDVVPRHASERNAVAEQLQRCDGRPAGNHSNWDQYMCCICRFTQRQSTHPYRRTESMISSQSCC